MVESAFASGIYWFRYVNMSRSQSWYWQSAGGSVHMLRVLMLARVAIPARLDAPIVCPFRSLADIYPSMARKPSAELRYPSADLGGRRVVGLKKNHDLIEVVLEDKAVHWKRSLTFDYDYSNKEHGSLAQHENEILEKNVSRTRCRAGTLTSPPYLTRGSAPPAIPVQLRTRSIAASQAFPRHDINVSFLSVVAPSSLFTSFKATAFRHSRAWLP